MPGSIALGYFKAIVAEGGMIAVQVNRVGGVELSQGGNLRDPRFGIINIGG